MLKYELDWLDTDTEELPKTTLEGLRAAIDDVPARPEALSWEAYQDASGEEQLGFDRARRNYAKRSLRVPTAEQTAAEHKLQMTVSHNRQVANSRQGMMLSAPSFFGKTELSLYLARSVEMGYARRHTGYREMGHAPVAWLEVTPNATGKSLLRSLIDFYTPAATPPRSADTAELLRTAGQLTREHHTRLLVIDEANHLGGREPSGFIKLMQNQMTATILLTGVNLVDGKAFGTYEGRQVTSRCEFVNLPRIDLADAGDADIWRRWLIAFDRNLPLCDHRPGMLVDNAQEIHRATGGQLGYLALVVTKLIDGIIFDEHRTNERVSGDRLFAAIEAVQSTRGATGAFGGKRRVTRDKVRDAA